MILALLAAGALALGAGTALAAPASSTAKTSTAPAAVAPAAKTPAANTEAKESPTIQKAERAREAREEKGEPEATADHAARGVVTHVEPMAVPPTMVMKAMDGKQELVVGVDVPATTVIREGKSTKTLQDIKAGDHVWMRWDRQENRLVADQIQILKPNAAAAMKTAPAVAKNEVAKKSE
jgi:Cu/Ag efflux protein CusF